MSIFQPRAVFKAQINGSLTSGARTIPFDNITLGTIADVEVGMTLWVGSTAGAKDIGKIRIKSKSAGQFEVSENSNIAWADNLYITVVRYWELWSIYPRIIQNPADEEDVIFYKDYDIPYVNQNSILGTFPCAGNHQALFAGEQVYYTATGSFNPLGDTLSYEWSFEGGTPTGSTALTPGFVTYPTPGHYVTRLMISGSSGGNDTTYRYVSVYNKPWQGSNPPVIRWELSSAPAGSRDEGGYTASFRVHDDIDIDENSVIVLFSEDWYGSTKQSLGGNSPNNERIFFVGHVLQNSIRKNYQHSYIEFSVGSITEVMKTALSFSMSVESKASPAYWFELLDMDCRRAIYHYLKWHTTAMSLADFQFLGTDYKIQFFDADRTSMYDAIDNLMRNALLGKVVSDRQGKVWMEVDARAYLNPTGSFSSVMEITKRDWMGEPTIEQRFSDVLSYYEAGGIHYSGVNTGTFSARLACAPGSAPSFRGSIEMPDGLAIGGQTHLNRLVGNVFANVNSRLPTINMEMVSARNLDIAPQETVQMTIQPEDTVAGVSVNGLYMPNNIDWQYDARNQILLAVPTFKNLVSGRAGETIPIPESVPDAGFDSGFSIPQFQIPPLPLLTIPPLFGGLGGSSTGSSCCDALAAFGLGYGVYSTLLTRVADTPETPGLLTKTMFGWEFSSNQNMYDPSNGRIALLNTGTIDYGFDITLEWRDTANPFATPGSENAQLHIELRNGSTHAFIATAISVFIGQPSYNGAGAVDDTSVGIGDQGSVTKSAMVIGNASYKSPNYLVAYVTGNTNPANFKVIFDNIRLSIEGTA